MSTNVQAAELSGYQQQAAELHRIAEALASVPEGAKRPYVSLTIIVAEDAPGEVDVLAELLLGKLGKTQLSSGSWYHSVNSYTSERSLTIQCKVAGPPDERDAELERLRAENERLRAEQAVPNYGRGDEGGQVVACPAHGAHPHENDGGGPLVCLDCPTCRPPSVE